VSIIKKPKEQSGLAPLTQCPKVPFGNADGQNMWVEIKKQRSGIIFRQKQH